MRNYAQTQTQDLIGTPDELRNALERAYADGRLVSLTAPRPVVHVRVRLLPESPPASRGQFRLNPVVNPRPYLTGAVVMLGSSVVGLVAYGIVRLVLAVVYAIEVAGHWLAVNGGTIAGGALLVVLALIFCRGGKSSSNCSGIHCSGCDR